MSPQRVIAIVDDLMVTSRIESTSVAVGTPVEFARSAEELAKHIDDAAQAVVLLVGMAATRLPWEQLIQHARKRSRERSVPLRVIAFGPHMDLSLRGRALAAGADEVIANSKLMTELPGLLSE